MACCGPISPQGQSAQNGGVDEAHKGAFQFGQLLPVLLHGDGQGRAQEGAGLRIYVVLHDLRQAFRQLPVDELTQGVGVHVLQASVGQEGEDGVGPVGELPGEGLAQPRLCGLLHQESAKKGGQVLPLLDILIRSKGLDEQLPGGLVRCGCRFKELIQPIGDGCFGFGTITYENGEEVASIGPNDLDLMKRLRKAGSDHRKYLRMINVTMDITAMQPWWFEFDTYKVGTVRNSCSKMHKIHSKTFTTADFAHDGIDEVSYAQEALTAVIAACERSRPGI